MSHVFESADEVLKEKVLADGQRVFYTTNPEIVRAWERYQVDLMIEEANRHFVESEPKAPDESDKSLSNY